VTVTVGVPVADLAEVDVAVAVDVTVAVEVCVAVSVIVGVALAVAVRVAVAVAVAVCVAVAVDVCVAVDVAVAVGVGLSTPTAEPFRWTLADGLPTFASLLIAILAENPVPARVGANSIVIVDDAWG
jgi:hypothetical protein